MNPLTRAEGDDVNSPIDPAYPGRYYVNPPCHVTEHPEALPDGAQEGYVINMQYQLPEGLTCDHCVLQMVHCEFSQQQPCLPTTFTVVAAIYPSLRCFCEYLSSVKQENTSHTPRVE